MQHFDSKLHPVYCAAVGRYSAARLARLKQEMEHDATHATGIDKLKAKMWLDNWALEEELEASWVEMMREEKQSGWQDIEAIAKMVSRVR